MNAHLEFWGAVESVTGSMHVVEFEGKRVLLDCGLYQGRREEARERNMNLPFDPRAIHSCILSHAHIDHSGNLPNLVKSGFDGPIYAPPPRATSTQRCCATREKFRSTTRNF